MSFFETILNNFPEVARPTQKRLSFKEKMKWTGIVLLLFFALGLTPLVGLGKNALSHFELISVILGAQLGSITSLGVGPIVTASIVLQLLNGSGLVKFDLTTKQGKQRFQGVQKLLILFLIIFESAIYVFMGGLAPAQEFAGTGLFFQLELLLIFQMTIGGLLIVFMDDLVQKWGFGSGVSLFIAANVSQSLFLRLFSPLALQDSEFATGAIPALFQSLAAGMPDNALSLLAAIGSTVFVFVIAVYAQSMKVEIPLSFGRVRGHGIRWPLSFIYTSVMPVIMVSALLANIQLWARLLQSWGHPILGTIDANSPSSGIVSWLSAPNNLVVNAAQGGLTVTMALQGLVYLLLMIAGCVLFSWFWMQTSGMDARSQAKQMMSSGLQIPGFRKDERVLERLLERYIGPLTIMGGIAIGLLAGIADISGSLTGGTSLMLAVMIIYRFYEDITRHHLMDMNPMLRKFMGG